MIFTFITDDNFDFFFQATYLSQIKQAEAAAKAVKKVFFFTHREQVAFSVLFVADVPFIGLVFVWLF